MANKKCAIVGAGLVGSLFAIILKRRGYDVTLYEKRSDMRALGAESGRSINLIVTAKGIAPLEKLELWEKVKEITSPVKGRMMHSLEGELTYQPYGIDDDHINYSVSRSELNILLMNQAEQEGVPILFEKSLENIDFDNNQLKFENSNNLYEFDFVVGADGAGSIVRKELLKATDGIESIQMIESDYKELLMPSGPNNSYPIDENSLHIWPRGSHMLMALPNRDGSFTMTLYLNNDDSEVSFTRLKSENDLQLFFEKYYKDSIELMPDFKKEFFENPQGKLGIVRCAPWNYSDKAVLVGDAAHAIVPFFGQGMNCGFEDCFHLMNLLDTENSLSTVFQKYFEIMKPNGDAIADMALENFIEMRDKVADENFLLKKRVEKLIEKKFPFYISRYSQVVHTLTPYKEAQDNGKIQDEMLTRLCENISNESELNWEDVEKEVRSRFA